jgi:hypothetical protein
MKPSITLPDLTDGFLTTLLWVGPLVLVFLLVSLIVIHQWRAARRVSGGWVLLLGFIALLARIPGILSNKVTNIDEAQTIAHALTLIRSPEPWKHIDFTTNGPLNAYVYFIPHWMGLPIDYLVSHVILLLLQVLLVVTLFVTIRVWMGRDSAVITLIPLLAFLGFAQHQDFTHHSSEVWCIVPLSAAIALFSSFTLPPGPKRQSNWFWIGLLLGTVPFGKPQGAPPALLAALMILIWILVNYRGGRRWRAASWLIGGGLAMSTIFGVQLYLNGSLSDFFDLYIRANLLYAAQHGGGGGLLPHFLWGWAMRTEVALLFALTMVLLLWGVIRGRAMTSRERWVGVFILVIVYGGAYAVQRAGRAFDHYMLLFIFPGVFLLFGWGVSLLNRYRHRGYLISVTILIFVGYTVCYNRSIYHDRVKEFLGGGGWKLETSKLSAYVKKWADQPDDYITVYGYYNEIYVETQLPSAARLVTVYQHSSIWPELYMPYYYADLVAKRPAVIVDALDVPQDFREEIFVNRAAHSPEKIPQIWSFIQENYQLATVLDRGRVYVRNDRWGGGSAIAGQK